MNCGPSESYGTRSKGDTVEELNRTLRVLYMTRGHRSSLLSNPSFYTTNISGSRWTFKVTSSTDVQWDTGSASRTSLSVMYAPEVRQWFGNVVHHLFRSQVLTTPSGICLEFRSPKGIVNVEPFNLRYYLKRKRVYTLQNSLRGK